MSTSLRIEGGDLVVGIGRSFETVSGAQKLAQDLRLWVLERVGTDPATPTFGNTLDGGFLNGVHVDGVIGQLMTTQRILEVQAIVQDLLHQYQTTQLSRIKQDMVDFNGVNTLDAEETIDRVQSVNAKAIGDTIIVRAIVLTMAGKTLTVTLPVGV